MISCYYYYYTKLRTSLGDRYGNGGSGERLNKSKSYKKINCLHKRVVEIGLGPSQGLGI